MAEELQGLLDKIQSEGIAKAESEKNAIMESAKQESAKIIEEAKKEAAELIRKAEEEAEMSRSKGAAAIRQAARDVIIALRADMEKRLKSLVTDCLGEAMTPEVMGQIVLEMVKAYREKNPAGEVSVEVLLQQKDAVKLEKYLKAGILKDLKANPVVSIGGDFSSGLQLGFKGSDVFLDFSDDALTDVICAYVGPKLTAAIKG